MFSLCMVESEADEVTLQGVTSVGLKNALDFAYTGQVSVVQHLRHNGLKKFLLLLEVVVSLESEATHNLLSRQRFSKLLFFFSKLTQ